MNRALLGEEAAQLHAALVVLLAVAVAGVAHAGVVDDRGDAARPRRHHDDAPAEEDRLLDRVRDEHLRVPAALPQLEQHVLQVLALERVERRERLVHEQQVGVERDRAREPEPLPHAARELAGYACANSASPTRSSASALRRARSSRADAAHLQARGPRSPRPSSTAAARSPGG